MTLSEHFTLEEMTASESAARLGIDNKPSPAIITNLVRVAQTMEQIRALLNHPIKVNSGYRSALLNDRVGGSKTSAHLRGLACDFICPEFGSPFEIAKYIARMGVIPFDQLIHEYGTWVHLGLSENAPRQQTLSIFTGTGYIPGIWKDRQSADAGR